MAQVRKLSQEERQRIEVGLALADVREAARMTQQELADLLEISMQTLSHMEAGRLKKINYLRMRSVAELVAGKGWLDDDADGIRQYVLGERDELPIRVARRSAEAQGFEPWKGVNPPYPRLLTVIEGEAA